LSNVSHNPVVTDVRQTDGQTDVFAIWQLLAFADGW